MYYYEQPRYRLGFGGERLTEAVKYLLIANAIAFFFQQLFNAQMIGLLALNPRAILTKFYIWQIVTYMFLHGGFLHILLNMFILWMFGCEVERYVGFDRFLKYYFICGIGGGLLHMIIYPNSTTIGASGAIYGVLVAFALLFPDRPIMLFPLFITLKAKHWVMIFVAIEVLFGITGKQDGTAHFAHLGGMIAGFIYFKFRLADIHDFFKRKRDERRMISIAHKRKELEQLRSKIDFILDKINEVGYENLTDEERQVLKEASDLFSKG